MRRIALVAVAAVALSAATAGAAGGTVKAGIEAWQKGDYPAAVAIWRPLAETGNADASFNLGQAYRLGRGVPINLAAAQTWLLRAANKNHLDAQTTLGLLLFNSGDVAASMRWFKAAAERGDPRAQVVYGTALFNGDGVTRNPALGYAFVSRSAAQGLAPAKQTLRDLQAILPREQREKAEAMAAAATKGEASSAPVRAMDNPVVAKPKTARVKTGGKAASPKPERASPAVAHETLAGAWRIQLGAFSKRSSAEALFKRWSSALAGKQPIFSATGAVTRLQVGPYPTKAAAQTACASLSRKGQACFPVSPK